MWFLNVISVGLQCVLIVFKGIVMALLDGHSINQVYRAIMCWDTFGWASEAEHFCKNVSKFRKVQIVACSKFLAESGSIWGQSLQALRAVT